MEIDWFTIILPEAFTVVKILTVESGVWDVIVNARMCGMQQAACKLEDTAWAYTLVSRATGGRGLSLFLTEWKSRGSTCC